MTGGKICRHLRPGKYVLISRSRGTASEGRDKSEVPALANLSRNGLGPEPSSDMDHTSNLKSVGISPHASQSHHSTFRSHEVKRGTDAPLADHPSCLRSTRRVPAPYRQGGADAIASAKDEAASFVLERFEGKLSAPVGARLLDVELSESVLTEIGYFVD